MSLLHHSVFFDALFTNTSSSTDSECLNDDFALRRWIRHEIPPKAILSKTPIVVFDTETTGLDADLDRIIEFGAMKYLNGEKIGEYWSLVRTDIELTDMIRNMTGISQDMVKDAPTITEVLPQFLEFMRGSVLVAHNAEFDMSMLHATCGRLGYVLEWPCFCTMKLARRILPGLPNYKLDTLAEHFSFKFEERHRAVGDVKVLASIVDAILDDEEFEIETWQDLQDAIIVA
jgi:DNA polymerase-3 subunit alpha (Gram-positive type)